jgi:hypothetical protein
VAAFAFSHNRLHAAVAPPNRQAEALADKLWHNCIAKPARLGTAERQSAHTAKNAFRAARICALAWASIFRAAVTFDKRNGQKKRAILVV